MDSNEIIDLLEGHRDRLVVAIKALTGETSSTNGNGVGKRARKMSAATKRRMSLAMKKRWREKKRAA